MLRDVMTAASGVAIASMLSSSPAMRARRSLAQSSASVSSKTLRNESETAAIEMATAWCEEHGYDTTVVDARRHSADHQRRAASRARRRSRGRCGVRARLRSARQQLHPAAAGANLIPLRFGNDSFLPHCEAMRQTGKPLVILEMPGIGLDIDNPHELDLLSAARRRHPRAAPAALVGLLRLGDGTHGSGRLMPMRFRDHCRQRDSRHSRLGHRRSLLRRFHRRPGHRRACARRSALSRRRHSRGQAQDRLQGGRTHGRARLGEAVGGGRSALPRRTAPMPASSNWPCARPSGWCARQHVLITETAHGFVCANSGVDVSNVDGGKTAVLLPARSRPFGREHSCAKSRSAPRCTFR